MVIVKFYDIFTVKLLYSANTKPKKGFTERISIVFRSQFCVEGNNQKIKKKCITN